MKRKGRNVQSTRRVEKEENEPTAPQKTDSGAFESGFFILNAVP
jgi:hypothetical protein